MLQLNVYQRKKTKRNKLGAKELRRRNKRGLVKGGKKGNEKDRGNGKISALVAYKKSA